MLRRLTTSLMLVLMLGLPTRLAQAQDEPLDVTVREINKLRPTGLDSLINLLDQLTEQEIISAATPALAGKRVRFTAFVLTDVRNSGLATYRPTNTPPIGRVHVYVRDTSAISQGVDGMDIQIVDGDFESTGILYTLPGDVVEIDAVVTPYFGEGGVSMQLSPISVVPTDETYEDFGVGPEILDPVLVTTADVNQNVGDGKMSINWANYERLNSQYVRMERVRVIRRDLGIDDERPDFDVSSDGGVTVVPMYDTSLRYRNDRNGEYYSDFNVRPNDDDYVPPPPGTVINIQGNLIFQGDDPFGTAAVGEIQFLIIPWEDSDVEILESPPIASVPTKPDFVPGADPVEVSVEVSADPSRTLTSVVLKYFVTMPGASKAVADTMEVTPSSVVGDTYTFAIPAAPDGAFVTYFVVATDSEGATSKTEPLSYRVLADGINEIADVQYTLEGDRSPFVGITTAMDLEVTVQSSPGTSGIVAVQDDAALGPWSGILITGEGTAALNPGDVIRITSGTVAENFGVTEIQDVTFESVSTGGAPLGYKTVTTDVLQDADIAEAHEGMLLRFEDVLITSIESFGEWTFSSDGTEENAVFADDASNAIPSNFNATAIAVGEVRDFIQGIWWYSFGAYKLVPETTADVGVVTNVSVDENEVPAHFALKQNYPNPFNPVTTIEYSIPAVEQVKLSVFDVLGREVAVLVDGSQTPGAYTVTFDASSLPSGLYLYRLEAGGQSIVRSMMLLK